MNYLPDRNKKPHKILNTYTVVNFVCFLLDSASILTLKKMPKMFHLEFI